MAQPHPLGSSPAAISRGQPSRAPAVPNAQYPARAGHLRGSEQVDAYYNAQDRVRRYTKLFPKMDGFEIGLHLHQYNVLVSRAGLISQYGAIHNIISKENLPAPNLADFREKLYDYNRAIDEYKLFKRGPRTWNVSKSLRELGCLMAWRNTHEGGELDPHVYNELLRGALFRLESIRDLPGLANKGDSLGYTGVHAHELKLQRAAFQARATMALLGGVALIAPMLIMVLHPTKLTRVLTTSLFVLVIGILLAWRMDTAEPKDIIAATAAYAAVLVVFVGTAPT